MPDYNVPVLIVGGGGSGLTASILLDELNVETLLVNARPTTSDLPKAHVINQRAMEILGDMGVAEEIYARGTPPQNMRATAWYAEFAKGPAEGGPRVAKLDAWGSGYTDPAWVAASPCASTNLPQSRLEPILRAEAERRSADRVRFHHEVVDIAQDQDGVTTIIRSIDDNREYSVRSQYVLGCDGGRTIGPKLGIDMQGLKDVAQEVSVHMSSDLSQWAKDDDVLIRWIWLAKFGAMCVLVPMGPDQWGSASEEWVFHLNYPSDDVRALDDTAIIQDMRDALGIGDHPCEIHKITRWSLEGVVASSLQVNRVFLLGDAAHRHPPTGGLGLNGAIQDAHNICWKLAAVLHGHAEQSLLNTYESERKPVVQKNVDRSVENALNHLAIGEFLGIQPEHDEAHNTQSMQRLWSNKKEDEAFRREAFRRFASQSMEFNEHNIEYGYTYVSPGAAIITEFETQLEPVDSIRIYCASTAPGHPLPHAFLESYDGTRLSTLDLVAPDLFLLIAGEAGDAWCKAARAVADNRGLPLTAVTIGHLEGDYLDPHCSWLNQREIASDGAILIRPDRFVAWRSIHSVQDPSTVLDRVLIRLLGAKTSLTPRAGGSHSGYHRTTPSVSQGN